jgi:hypothetical protein
MYGMETAVSVTGILLLSSGNLSFWPVGGQTGTVGCGIKAKRGDRPDAACR